MYEYRIMNKTTGETSIMFGYTFKDAAKRWNVDLTKWEVLSCEYVD